MSVWDWIAAHYQLLTAVVGTVLGAFGAAAGIRYNRAATRKAHLDIAAIPAAAWEHAADAYRAELDLIRGRVALLEPLAAQVPELADKVARLERENLTLRLAGGKERKTIAKLKARIAQLVQVIEDMGGTVPPEVHDPPADPAKSQHAP